MDFKTVDAAFQKNVAELKAAGTTLVDPIVIPNLKNLLATRERNPIETEAVLELYLARNPGSPFKTRADIINSPDIEKAFRSRTWLDIKLHHRHSMRDATSNMFRPATS